MVNPYDANPVQKRKAERMVSEFALLGVDVEILPNDGFAVYLKDGNVKCNLHTDFVLYFDKERIVPRLLEKAGVRVFNSASATEICDDKMLTHTVLANCGIPMPDTVAGPLCYDLNVTVADASVSKAVQTLGLPVVVKECHGSFGQQVYLCRTARQLKVKLNRLKTKPYLLQRFESASSGTDLRVIVIGGKAVCAMKRTNNADFRSNASLGGVCEGVPIPAEVAAMCEKAAQTIGLDYCGADVLLTDPPKLCEINSNAMFEAMERATGVNVAAKYAQYIKNCVERGA